MLNTYLNYVQEGILFNKKPISYDLDQFQSGKYKKLFIMGLPGAGKTTISHTLEKKYNIPVYHTDDYYNRTVKYLWDKLPKEKQIIGMKTKDIVKASKLTIEQYFWMCWKDGMEPIVKSNKKLILEGTLFGMYGRFPNIRALLIQYPSIVLGKSLVKAGIDRSKRDKRNALKYIWKELQDKSKLNSQLKLYIKDKTNHSTNIKEWDGKL